MPQSGCDGTALGVDGLVVPPRAVPVGMAVFRRAGQPGGGLAQAQAVSSRFVLMRIRPNRVGFCTVGTS
eukprot:360503-Chlamydomonas_euryale.AAC.2